ncbi:MAG: flippase [Deltaproteobacteria bacterium]|nr:flippase [Deltaproteobacteria bacterium]
MLDILKLKFADVMLDKNFSEVLTGSFWALAARVSATFASLLISVFVSRFYGATMLGTLAIINASFTILSIFTLFGINTSIIRLIPEYLTKFSASSAFKLFRTTQTIVIFASICMSIFIAMFSKYIAIQIYHKPNLSHFFMFAAWFIAFRSLMDLYSQAIRGLGLIRAFAVMQFLPSFSMLLILTGLTLSYHDNANPVYAQISAWIFTAIVGYILISVSFKKKRHIDDVIVPISYKKILAISSPMMMTTSIHFIISQTGIILLGIFRTEADVGFYSIAVKLSTLTVFALYAINSMAATKFSELYANGRIDELFLLAQKSSKLIFFVTVPIIFILIIFGKPLISIAFGNEFTKAYFVLVVLIIGQFVSSTSGSTGYFMNMTGNQIVFRNIMITTGILNILFNLFFIKLFGIFGAALSSTLSLALWNIWVLLFLKKRYGKTLCYLPFIK